MPAQFGIDLKGAKKCFFDRLVVEDAFDAAEKMALGKLGAYIRTRASRSMRRRKKGRVSPAGKPPFAHAPTKQGLRNILYAYNPATGTVVVGPVRFRGRGMAPKLMEFGGRTKPRKGNVKRYAKRPYMNPAMDAEAPKAPSMYAAALARVDKRKPRRRR